MTLLKNAFIVATVLAAQGANAWTFKWRDESGAVTNEAGGKTTDCKPIEHAEGKLFEWDSKGDGLCISMFADEHCKEGRVGLACDVWNKKSSGDLRAFKIDLPKDVGQALPSSGDSTATATDSGSATGTASETGSGSATGTETGSASEPTGKPTDKPTKTGSETGSGGGGGTATAPKETNTKEHNSGVPGAPAESEPTDAASASGASDAPASSTQTGAASPTGAPISGIVGALAAVAAVAL